MLSSLSSTIITVFDIADLAYLGPDASAKTLRGQRSGGSARQPPLGQGMRVTANGRSPDRAGNELSHCAAGRASRSAVQRKRKVKERTDPSGLQGRVCPPHPCVGAVARTHSKRRARIVMTTRTPATSLEVSATAGHMSKAAGLQLRIMVSFS